MSTHFPKIWPCYLIWIWCMPLTNRRNYMRPNRMPKHFITGKFAVWSILSPQCCIVHVSKLCHPQVFGGFQTEFETFGRPSGRPIWSWPRRWIMLLISVIWMVFGCFQFENWYFEEKNFKKEKHFNCRENLKYFCLHTNLQLQSLAIGLWWNHSQ